MQKISFVIIALVLISSCVKDKPNDPVPVYVQSTNTKKVLVVNEGNFGSKNAGVSLYDKQTNTCVEDLYFSQNASTVGDVAQSLSYWDGLYYLVINNSGKVIICNEELKKQAEIKGLQSPRYFLKISNQKAYVSDLYANAISIVDLNSNTKTGSIPCYGKTEQMIQLYNKVFVTNTDKGFVYVVNCASDKIEDSVYVGFGASSVVLDRTDKVWVLASGDQSKNKGRLSKINAIDMTIESFVEFDLPESPWHLCINKTKDTLFYLNNHIYRMAVTEATLPQNPLVQKGSKNFYGLGIDPNTFSIYAADAIDYSQRSSVYLFDQKGQQTGFFKAGINANSFYFE